MRRAHRLDENHQEMVNGIGERLPAARVQSLAAVGDGVPDVLVGMLGVNVLLEFKGPRGKLTDDQIEWHAKWRGQACVVRTVDEAVDVIVRCAQQWLRGAVGGGIDG